MLQPLRACYSSVQQQRLVRQACLTLSMLTTLALSVTTITVALTDITEAESPVLKQEDQCKGKEKKH